MAQPKRYLAARIGIGLMALVMLAATVPAYADPTFNPGLGTLTGDALSLGQTAGAFLGRQLTLVLIALIGAVSGKRHFLMMGAFGMLFMNGHDALLMGLFGGPGDAAIGGLAFAVIAFACLVVAWRHSESE